MTRSTNYWSLTLSSSCSVWPKSRLRFYFQLEGNARSFFWYYRLRPYSGMLGGGEREWSKGYRFNFNVKPHKQGYIDQPLWFFRLPAARL